MLSYKQRINNSANTNETHAGHQLKAGGDSFAVSVTGPQDVSDVPVTDNSDGTYDGAYMVEKPGRYQVHITLDSAHIKGSPYALLIEAARASLSHADGPGLEGGVSKQATHFTVHGVDIEGNARTDGGDPFIVEISGPGEVAHEIKDNNDGTLLCIQPESAYGIEVSSMVGTYTVSYAPPTGGNYTINVKLHDENIKALPATVHVLPSFATASGKRNRLPVCEIHAVINILSRPWCRGERYQKGLAIPCHSL